MGIVSAPALPFAVAGVLGVALARALAATGSVAEWAWGAAGIVVAIGLPRSVGLLLGAASIGWMVTLWRAPVPLWPGELDLERPVSVVGRLEGHWRRSPFGWSARLRVDSTHQGRLATVWPEEVLLLLPPIERPPVPRHLRVRGRFSRPHPLANGVRTGRPMWRLALKSVRLLENASARASAVRPPPGSALRGWVAHSIERAVARGVGRAGRPRAAALARALVLGDPSGLPKEWLITLRRAGLGHLLAVSGLHVGLALSIAWIGCAVLPPKLRLLPCGVVIVAYMMVVGARPSLVRAAWMAGLGLASMAGERKPLLLNSWAVSIAVMTLWSPRIVEDLAFQLTAAATLGLLTLAPVLRRRWAGLPPVLTTALAASVAAHIATLPWSLAVFHQWTPAALLLNLVAVPWTALCLAVSFAAIALGWIVGIGEPIWRLLELLAGPFGWLAELPGGAVGGRPVTLDWWRSCGAAALLAGATLCRRTAGTIAGVVLAVVAILGVPGGSPPPSIVVLDVGQGEAVLLRDGAASILIDGGGGLAPGIAAREVVPALRRLAVTRLSEVVSTHPDLDHCAGLMEISLLLPIESLRAAPGWAAPCYRALIRRPGIRYRPVWEGERWAVGGWCLEVLHPPPGQRGGGNERSLVLRASYEDLSVLLTGDLGLVGERRLLANHARRLPSTALKLGHHGSRGSTHEAFLDAVGPRVALASSGRGNVYGHPSAALLDRLLGRGVPVWRTDLAGQIVIERQATGRWAIRQPWAGMKRGERDEESTEPSPALVESGDERPGGDRRTDGCRQE